MQVNLDNTLEQLDKEDWGKPPYDSHLVTTCYKLRKKPLRDFTTEDLRISVFAGSITSTNKESCLRGSPTSGASMQPGHCSIAYLCLSLFLN